MILADKIIENRKKNGWSQEELADRLGVSRQSVSKWEGAQAIPDIKKIMQMSEIFGVSTDYLLKDEIEEEFPMDTPVDNGLEDAVRMVSMEEANDFLAHVDTAARQISTGVMLCILSPVLMILLGGLAEIGVLPIEETYASIIGLVILLIMVACTVGIFIAVSMRGKRFDYLEDSTIDTAYGVNGMVKEYRNDYAPIHSRRLIVGIMLCIVAAVPLLIMQLSRYSNNTDLLPILGLVILLVMVAVGVKLIVLTCTLQGGYDKLLEEGDYTRLNKRAGRFDGVYWAIVLAIYLGWSFYNMRWDMTWIVWPIAGVLFAAYREIIKAVIRSRR